MLLKIRSGLTYANVMATAAVFIALGGGAYAALKLPRNSVGPTQIKKNAVSSSKVKNHSLLAGDFKAGQLPAGPQGIPGAQGVQGVQGIQGLQGDRGPAGPTAAFGFDSHGFGDPPATEGTLPQTTILATTTVTLPVAGRLFVRATQKSTLTALGGGGGGPTEETYGIYVDGQAVANTKDTIDAVPTVPATKTVSSVGVTGVLVPGAHHVDYAVTKDDNRDDAQSTHDEGNLWALLVAG
jgi:hypothetical protein